MLAFLPGLRYPSAPNAAVTPPEPESHSTMGRFDRRNSKKMKRRRAQNKKKEREARKRQKPAAAPAPAAKRAKAR